MAVQLAAGAGERRSGARGSAADPLERPVLVVRCTDTQSMFSLERERDDYWLARLDGQGVSAQCSVYAYLGEGIGEFFRSMARDWRGWAGTRSWSSLEGDL